MFVSNEKGILEPMGGTKIAPEEVDFVIVPGLSFDEQGHRLGRGGGYYDRLLNGAAAFKLGLALKEQMTERVPRENRDVKMDAVACEFGIYC